MCATAQCALAPPSPAFSKAWLVGVRGFEPPAPASRTQFRRANALQDAVITAGSLCEIRPNDPSNTPGVSKMGNRALCEPDVAREEMR